MVLFRGVLSGTRSAIGHSRRTAILPGGQPLTVDGYNVLFTLLNYREGAPLFIATDGFLRDTGDLHGRIRNHDVFREGIGLLLEGLAALGPAEVRIALDGPVSNSARHAALIAGEAQKLPFPVSCPLLRSADYLVSRAEAGVVATSDSVVIDAVNLPVFDLARFCLERRYAPDFIDIALLAGL